MSENSVCLVIPCFNEAPRLRTRVERFSAWLEARPESWLVFVDDGSDDQTAREVQNLVDRHPHARLVILEQNFGKGEAVRAGMRHALQHADCAFFGYWDADLATPLEQVERLLLPLRLDPSVQLTMGCRLASLGRRIERSQWRHYAGRLLATGIAHVLGLPVYDSQCGAKLFRRSENLAELWNEPFASRWLFDVELLARLMRCHPDIDFHFHRLVLEVPLDRWTDIPGSKVTARDFFPAVRDLWNIRATYQDVLPARRA